MIQGMMQQITKVLFLMQKTAVHIKSNRFYNLQIIWLSFLISLDI